MPSSHTVNLESYYGLVIHRAKKVHRTLHQAGKEGIELRELIQEGFVGLLEARTRYDPRKKGSFATFATFRVEGAIRDYLRRLDPLTQREREKVKELDQAREELGRSLGREPAAEELAQALGLSEKEVRKREALRVTLLSLEDPARFDEEAESRSLWEIPAADPDPEGQFLLDCTEEALKKLTDDVGHCREAALDRIERTVLILRVLDDLTLQGVGRLLNLSKDTVKRREVEASRKMRRCLESKGWEVADILGMLP